MRIHPAVAAFGAVLQCVTPAGAQQPASPPAGASAQAQTAPSAQKTQTAPAAPRRVDPSLLVELEGEDTLLDVFHVTVEEVEGRPIYGVNKEKIGEIESVLGTSNGKVAAVTIEVGGFLGIGERHVIIPVDAIGFDGLRMSVDMSKEELEALPEWKK